MKFSNLSFCVWNVGGLISNTQSKLDDPLFVETINKYDIILLTETHLGYNTIINLPGYHFYPICRNLSKNRRYFGGLGIFIRENIRPGIKLLENKCKEYQWLKLDKSFFNLSKETFLCLAYVIPANSSFSIQGGDEVLENIQSDARLFLSKNSSVIMCGDFNARTGSENDYIPNDTNDEHVPLYDDYECDLNIDPRNSMDKKVDQRGKQLLEFCISTKMRMLNGRMLGDSNGKFTCIKSTGQSVVDYVIVSEDLLRKILYFKVSDFKSTLSDCHCMLSYGLLTTYYCNNNISDNECKLFPGKFVWDDVSHVKLQEALESDECSVMMKDFTEKIFDDPGVEDINKALRVLVTLCFMQHLNLFVSKNLLRPNENIENIKNGSMKIYSKKERF